MTDAQTGSEPAWRTARSGPLIICAVAYGVALLVAYGVVLAWPAGHPIAVALAADVAATVVVFGFSMLTRNSSLYDPFWSVAPPVIFLFWMLHPYASLGLDLRQWLVLIIVTAWGARLTFNCFRRWKDMTEEDFRYIDLRAKSGKWYPLMDFFGIELFPTLLVFLALLPLWPAAAAGAPFGVLDIAAVVVAGGAILIETLADEHLMKFKRTNTDPQKVCDVGLWSWSQHPNYFGEVMFWWGLWLFGMAADPSWWWTIIGPLAMTGLFVFVSIPWMIKAKQKKRPTYDEQVKGRSVLVPWPPQPRS